MTKMACLSCQLRLLWQVHIACRMYIAGHDVDLVSRVMLVDISLQHEALQLHILKKWTLKSRLGLLQVIAICKRFPIPL